MNGNNNYKTVSFLNTSLNARCVVLSFLFLQCLSFSNLSLATSDPVAITPPEGFVPENLIMTSEHGTTSKYIFIADKKNRTLTVWEGSEKKPHLFGAFAMDIGKLDGDKSSAGDHRTPEGIYFFREKMQGPSLDFNLYGKKAFATDYPNLFDLMAGKTGSGIWLHAVPDTTSLLRGSKGCVVVRNETIDKLSDLIAINHSPLLILDHVNYVPYETLMQKRTEISTWLEEWRDSWQNKNIDKYISFYSNKFSALKMNKNVWKRYKAGLNDKYKFIKVAVKDPLIVIRNDQLIINYIQEYESDGLKDSGEKTLYVSRPSGQPAEILTETWKPLAEELLAHKKSED